MRMPDPNLPWPILKEMVAIIAERESCRNRAYPDPASGGAPWTCGWGETDGVTPDTRWTDAECDARFCQSLIERTQAVKAMCTFAPDDHELAAMVSLAYNIGLRDDKRKRGLYHTTVLRLHNAGDKEGAAKAFLLLDSGRDANGKLVKMAGLVARRHMESAFYLTPDAGQPHPPMPQVVEPERSMAASPTMQISGVGAGVGVVGALTQAGDALGPVGAMLQQAKTVAVDLLGSPPEAFPWLVLAFVGVVVLWRRTGQRAQGVA